MTNKDCKARDELVRRCKCGMPPVIFLSAGMWNIEGCGERNRLGDKKSVLIQAETRKAAVSLWNRSKYARKS